MAPLSFIHRSIPLSQKGSPIFHSPLSPAPFNPFHKRAPLSFIHRYHLSHLIPFTKGLPCLSFTAITWTTQSLHHKGAPPSFIDHYHLSYLIPFTKGLPCLLFTIIACPNQSLYSKRFCLSFNCSTSKNFFHCPQWPALLNTNPGLTLSPVLWIFSVSWSTAMLEGAHTKAGPLFCFTRWYTMVADVTVLPVPGGPCTHQAAPHVRWPGFGLSTALSQSAICAM